MATDIPEDETERQFHRVEIRPWNASFDCASDETLLEGSEKCGLHLFSNCQRGECGSCKVRVRRGQVKLAPFMFSALSMGEIEADYTLACRSYPRSGLVIIAEVLGNVQPRHYARPDE